MRTEKRQSTYSGFTLVELMVVMALMALLAMIIIGAISVARLEAASGAHRANARTIQTYFERTSQHLRRFCNTDTGTTVSYAINCNVPAGTSPTAYTVPIGFDTNWPDYPPEPSGSRTVYSFDELRRVGVNLVKSPCDNTDTVDIPGVRNGQPVGGGGYVWAWPTGYSIHPVDGNCKFIEGDKNKIEVK